MTTPSDATIFTGDNQTPPTGDAGELLNTLVGEGKKFKTTEDLARGKREADLFIEQMKNENAALRKELEERTTLEQSIEEIKRTRGQPAGKEVEPSASVAVDENKIKDLVKQTIDATAKSKEVETNILASDRAVVQHLGGDRAKAESFLHAKAKDLNVGIDFLMSMAGRSPKAFLNLLGIEVESKAPQTSVTQRSSVNTDANDFVPTGGIKQGSKEYFDEIRRTNKNLYWSPKIQNEIFQARKEGKYKI